MDTGYVDQDERRQLTDEQLALLEQVSQQEIVEAFDALLLAKGLPLQVRRVEFRELTATPASDPIGPDPSTGPDIPEPPPGGVYQCWRETPNGPWICICGSPIVVTSSG